MEDSTKKRLEKAGKIILGIAEFGVEAMQSSARSQSRNRKLPEEYRERYAEMADGFGNIRSTIHDYKGRIGQPYIQPDYDEEYEDDEYDDYDEDDDDLY